MAAVAEDKDAYRAGFERFAAAQSDPVWLRERRTAAMARFVARGLPTARDEAWRHTPVAPLAKGRFVPADPAARASADALAALPLEGLRGVRVVLVNGRLSPELSSLHPGQPGVEVSSLREVLRSQPGRLESWLGCVADGRTGVFADINTAFAEDGAVVLLAPGTVLNEPIHVAHLSTGDGEPAVSYARTLVVAGPGSECRLVETFASSAASGLAHERGHRGGGRGQRPRRPLQAPAGGRLGPPRRDAGRAAGARRPFRRPLALLRGRALPQRHRRALRGGGRGLRARRPLRRRRPPRGRHPLADRARAAPLLEPASSTRGSSTGRRGESSTASWWSARARRRPTPCR